MPNVWHFSFSLLYRVFLKKNNNVAQLLAANMKEYYFQESDTQPLYFFLLQHFWPTCERQETENHNNREPQIYDDVQVRS